MANLVIVESPAKAKTIAKYLGAGYQVKASVGHIRDLPEKKLGVDIKADFEPSYVVKEGKTDVIEELKKAAKKSDAVYLATDPDREGEAISWHLAYLLDLPLSEPIRVTFNEITKNAVNEGIRNPRHIDGNLVDAQQARRVLDRLVGYQLSPFLWKKIRRGLSAGRVQSVVTRMVVDREREIRAFVPEEYWSLDASLRKKSKSGPFIARYYGKNGEKVELKAEEQTSAVIAELEGAAYMVAAVKKGERKRTPPPPFTTSTLQQDAARKLGMASKRTMALAQQLYEGVEIEGRGLTGLITYMRTDSVRLSAEALAAIRGYIRESFGADYCPKSPRTFKSRGSSQDAHEAVRPSDVSLTPDMLKSSLNRDQLRLYKLIWERTVACQMSPAVYATTNADISAAAHTFKASGQRVTFKGYTALYDENEEAEENKDLPELVAGEELDLEKLMPEQHFTQPPPRYNEASLIRAMEDLGIGRPSTYAPTISVIIDRDYVNRDGKTLKPTNLGEVVTDLMIDKFADIVDIRFTAGMEDKLDLVESGEANWKRVVGDFYEGFEKELKTAENDLKGTRIKVADEPTDEVCEVCGRPMAIKSGRFGKFMSCTGYPECKNAKPIMDLTTGICPLCGGQIAKRKSKRGFAYYACEHHPKCEFMTWDSPLKEECPQCGKNLFQHSYKGERSKNCLSPGCGYTLAQEPKKSKKDA